MSPDQTRMHEVDRLLKEQGVVSAYFFLFNDGYNLEESEEYIRDVFGIEAFDNACFSVRDAQTSDPIGYLKSYLDDATMKRREEDEPVIKEPPLKKILAGVEDPLEELLEEEDELIEEEEEPVEDDYS